MAHSQRSAGTGKNPSDRTDGSKPADDRDAVAVALAPGLYLVSTPIGNLRDITLRALDTLGAADLVCCEDTRVTGKLLAAHGIQARLFSYHEHNAAKARPQVIKRLQKGDRVALVSDAGTPLISDPGYKLVRAAHEAGIPVFAVPGASAPVAALAVSGLPSDRFLFAGFLPSRSAQRKRQLADLARLKATLVFFETGPRLAAALVDLKSALGDREAAIARELTKRYEEVRRGTLGALIDAYADAEPPKGEIVVIVAPPAEAGTQVLDLDTELRRTLAAMSLKDAVAEVAALTGLPRRQVYARALSLAPSAGKLRTIE